MRTLVIVGFICAALVPSARADSGPSVSPDDWLGTWDVTMTSMYSTCSHMPEDRAVRATMVVTPTKRGFHAKVVPSGKDEKPMSYDSAGVTATIPPRLAFAWRGRTSEAGMRLSTDGSNSLSGIRVVTNRGSPPCGIVYHVTGVRMTDASGNRVGSGGAESDQETELITLIGSMSDDDVCEFALQQAPMILFGGAWRVALMLAARTSTKCSKEERSAALMLGTIAACKTGDHSKAKEYYRALKKIGTDADLTSARDACSEAGVRL